MSGTGFTEVLSEYTYEPSPWLTMVGPGMCFQVHRETGEKRPIQADLYELGVRKGDFVDETNKSEKK